MPIYEYQGQNYDLKEGLSNNEAKEKILNYLEEQKKEEDDKPNFFVGLVSGIASGALKIPEGFASLGAELYDLGS